MVPAGEAGAIGFHEKKNGVGKRKERANEQGWKEGGVPGSGKELSHAEMGGRSSGQVSMSVSASPRDCLLVHYPKSYPGSYEFGVRSTEPLCRMLCESHCVARGK